MPPKEKHRLHPEDPRDLVCGTCPARYPYQETPLGTRERARVAGWHVYQGPSMTGKTLDLALCPGCFKAGGEKRAPRVQVLPDQEDLLGLITPLPVPKKSERTSKRAIS
jgi:hypothetical protein